MGNLTGKKKSKALMELEALGKTLTKKYPDDEELLFHVQTSCKSKE